MPHKGKSRSKTQAPATPGGSRDQLKKYIARKNGLFARGLGSEWRTLRPPLWGCVRVGGMAGCEGSSSSSANIPSAQVVTTCARQ